jgi:hypothetical protein
MKFLKSHRDQPEADYKPHLSKKKRKKDQAHAKEEAISAYFTSGRPALAENDVNTQANEPCQKQLREKDPPSVVDNAIPTVELPDQTSYLGFGGRGPCHESGSYISWSESIRAPSVTLTRPEIEPTVNAGQLDSIHNGDAEESIERGRVLHSQPVPVTTTQHTTKVSSGRFQVSSLRLATGREPRSHSLPQHTSSPRRISLGDRVAKHRTLENVASPSPMPAQVSTPADLQDEHPQPACNAPVAQSWRTPLSGQGRDSVHTIDTDAIHGRRQPGVENVDPQGSSSLEKILEDCNNAFQEHRQAATVYAVNMAGTSASETTLRRTATTRQETFPTIQRIPTVRFSGVDEIYRPRIPRVTNENIYERQQQREFLARQQIFDQQSDLQEFCLDGVDNPDEGIDHEVYEWEEQPEDGLSNVEFRPSQEDDFEELFEVNEGRRSADLPSNVVPNPGFWRPHKLY